MALEIQREIFNGKYDGVSSPTILKPGDVGDGSNMRKASIAGGWKVRKGCKLHNSTALESSAAIKSLHHYKNPKQGDVHFLAQVNSKLYDATNDPPTEDGAAFGTDLGLSLSTTPGFSCVVDEWFIYADGSGKPIIWGGDNPFVFGFFVYDDSAGAYIDYSREVIDGRSDTYAIVLEAAADKAYVITSEPCEGLVFDLGTNVNSNAVTMTVKAWRSGAWAAVSDLSDGTASGGATLAQDGTVTWTRSTSDTMRIIGGQIFGYVYEISWSDALSGTVYIKSLKAKQDPTTLTNKWDGAFEWISGCRFYDQSAGQYIELISKVTSDATSLYMDLSEATTSDYIYIKTYEPALAFYFGIPDGYENTADAQVDLIEYWDGDSFTTVGTLTDTTLDDGDDSSFAQSGMISWNAAAITPQRRTLESDSIPGYWYRVSWDAALGTDVRVYMLAYAIFPVAIGTVKGCVEFKNRLLTWGHGEYPNRLRFSARGRPDCFSGTDSGWTDAIGGADEITAAVKFYNELLVFKEHGVYLLEGDDPFNFGYLQVSSTVGLASPKTVVVTEVGYPTAHKDEPLSVTLFQDVDGVYIIDGRKPRKISGPIDHYFDPEYSSTCIAAANINILQAFADPVKNEYHLLLPSSELVYNYLTDEWYPPWSREITLATGLWLVGTDNRIYTYAGSSSGLVMKLETDTTDKTTANADKAISHSIKSRAVGSNPDGPPALRFTLRNIWAEFKAQSAGTIITKVYKNLANTGTTLNKPSAMSMVNSGYSMAFPKLEVSEANYDCFELEFLLNTADQEMELRGFTYEREIRGVSS